MLAIAEPTIGTRVKALDLMDATVQDSIVRKLARKGTLWIWDNVETVTAMDATEQERFAQFIQRANNGGLKICSRQEMSRRSGSTTRYTVSRCPRSAPRKLSNSQSESSSAGR